MSKCGGIHCPGCGDGGGGGALVAVAAVIVIAAVIYRPVVHAISATGLFLAELLHVLLIVAEVSAIAAAAAAVCVLGAAVYRRRQRAVGQLRQAERIRQAAEAAAVEAILRRERLQPRTWRAEVIRPEIPTRTGGQK